jgi:hypothetical protein
LLSKVFWSRTDRMLRPRAIHDHVEDDVGDLFPACLGQRELEQFRARRVRSQPGSQRIRDLVVPGPHREPFLEQLDRYLGLDQVLVLRRAFPHRLGGRRAARRSHQRRIQPRPCPWQSPGLICTFIVLFLSVR